LAAGLGQKLVQGGRKTERKVQQNPWIAEDRKEGSGGFTSRCAAKERNLRSIGPCTNNIFEPTERWKDSHEGNEISTHGGKRDIKSLVLETIRKWRSILD